MMHPRTKTLRSLTMLVLACVGMCAPNAAATLLVPEHYPSFAAALAGATDGDRISLGAGSHSLSATTVISGLSLTIEGRTGARILFAEQSGEAFTITDSSDVTFRDVAIRGHFSAAGDSAIRMEGVSRHSVGDFWDKRGLIADGAASVSLVDCDLDAIQLTNVPSVQIRNCAVTGGRGQGASPNQDLDFPFGVISGGPGHAGYDALHLTACPNVQITNSSFLAGDGGGGISVTMSHFWGTFNAGPGGDGISALEGSHVIYTSSTFAGGLHGTPVYGTTPADGLPKVADGTSWITSTTSRVRAKNQLAPGAESTQVNEDR